MKRGDRFVVYHDAPLSRRIFIEVIRVARSGAWADIRCFTWAASWTERQPLPMRFAKRLDWTTADLEAQTAERLGRP